MLTRRSTTAAKTKMLVFMPLAVVCIVCFSKNSFSQKFEKNGNTVTYKGNKFELSDPKQDTMSIIDPVTGKENTVVARLAPKPVKMNGKQIPADVDKQPYFTGSDDGLRAYVLKRLRKELDKLDDGMYELDISNIVIDETGKIVYFDFAGVRGNKLDDGTTSAANNNVTSVTITDKNAPADLKGQKLALSKSGTAITISKTTEQELLNKLCKIMGDGTLYLPATLNGKKVPCIENSSDFWKRFKIKDHKLYERKNFQDIPVE